MRKNDYQMQIWPVRVGRWLLHVPIRALAAILLLGWWTLMLCPVRPPHTFPSGFVLRQSRKQAAASIWMEQLCLAHAAMGNSWDFDEIIADLMEEE